MTVIRKAVLLVTLASTSAGAQQGLPARTPAQELARQDRRIAQVDALFARWDDSASAGCALGIIQDGEFVYRRGYGMASIELGVPLSSASVFYIGSTSKQFVAASILLAEEQGLLSVDDDIRTYVPEIPDYGTPITIRHLLHHTSGVRDYLTLWDLAGEHIEDIHTADEVLALIARQRALNFEPGEEYLYSNSGYFLLSVIIERATGQSLRTFAQEHIFHPLGMTRTHFHDDYTHLVTNRAIGHLQRRDGSIALDFSNFAQVGSGGLYTSVDDLLLWDRNFYANRLGNGGLIEHMHRRGVLNNGDTLSYAAALQIGEYRGLRRVAHSGGLGGYRAELLRFPDERFSVICLCNLASIVPTRLAYQMANIYLADRFPPQPAVAEARAEERAPAAEAQATEPYRPDPAMLAEYAGAFYSEELDLVAELTVEQGGLRRVGSRTPVTPVSPDVFREGGVTIQFQRGVDGAVTHFTIDAERVRGIVFARVAR